MSCHCCHCLWETDTLLKWRHTTVSYGIQAKRCFSVNSQLQSQNVSSVKDGYNQLKSFMTECCSTAIAISIDNISLKFHHAAKMVTTVGDKYTPSAIKFSPLQVPTSHVVKFCHYECTSSLKTAFVNVHVKDLRHCM